LCPTVLPLASVIRVLAPCNSGQFELIQGSLPLAEVHPLLSHGYVFKCNSSISFDSTLAAIKDYLRGADCSLIVLASQGDYRFLIPCFSQSFRKLSLFHFSFLS
jgi:hypothetical protein